MPTTQKLIVITGITGNQGGSLAARFLLDPTYKIRGITRHATSPAALALADQGIEIVTADLENVHELKAALKGANLIFSVTNYWEPFFRPDCREEAKKQGISCRRFAYDVEKRQGINIADAAASEGVVEGLDDNGFIASTLSHATKCSKGKLTEVYHFDSKAEVFPYYVQEKHPKLAAKMSCVQTGFFIKSYLLAMSAYFGKCSDETYKMAFPCSPTAQIPHLAVNEDTGSFMYAVSKMRPRKAYMAESTTCDRPEYLDTFAKINGVKAEYSVVSLEAFVEATPDREFGAEVGDMYIYSDEPGYDGADKGLLKAADIRKAGIECPMMSLEEWMKNHDWSAVLSQ